MIGTQSKDQAILGLTQNGTTELEFKNTAIQVVNQIDANDIAIEATRTINLSGNVSGSGTFTLAGGINVTNTTVNMGAVEGTDIVNETIMSAQIHPLTIVNGDIANNTLTVSKLSTSRRLTVRNAANTVVFQLDGFGV